MRSFTLITALLLYSNSWISVSGSESQTVEVQPGEEVTLLCSNISKHATQTDWFRVVNRTKPRCISSLYRSDDEASYCDGFQNGFEMSSNTSTVFLKIKRVDLSDSGLYFCGFYINTHTVITSVTYLNVQGNCESEDEVNCETKNDPDGTTNLMTVILCGLTVFLNTVIIGLFVKIRKLKTAVTENPQPKRKKVNTFLLLNDSKHSALQNLASDDLNYAALSFLEKPKRVRKPASESVLEPNVVYAATR
uniref:Ig-like domain-containing protein n=1 Tax=Anabas testudineus TaxID=64144 RepID=A0A7N6BVR0_ANATE